MKKKYEAPSIQLISLIAAEPIAAKPWEWDPSTNNILNHWTHRDADGIASVNSWIPFDTEELD